MKLLWLTLANPHPADNGQFLYSAGLIRAAATNGCALCVVALRRPGSSEKEFSPGEKSSPRAVDWKLAPHEPRSKWRALVSRSPMLASRTKTSAMRKLLREQLTAHDWDAIVFDSIAMGWAITPIVRLYSLQPRQPKLIYIAHNHEERVARVMAKQGTSIFKRLVRHIDAYKLVHLERTLVRHAHLVTANTPEDCTHFAKMWPGRTIEYVPPGYGGPAVKKLSLSANIPRRAIVVGSFHWGPKQRSMEAFLKAADPIFNRARVELLVVGDAEKDFLDRLRPQLRATIFTGRVDDIFPYMRSARVAVVPDMLGGFKLKTLDYIFNRLPIFAMQGAVPGLPLQQGRSIFLFSDHRKLAEGIVALIDDIDRLNEVQNNAFILCRDQFDWAKIGEELVAAISRTTTRNGLDARAHPMPWTVWT